MDSQHSFRNFCPKPLHSVTEKNYFFSNPRVKQWDSHEHQRMARTRLAFVRAFNERGDYPPLDAARTRAAIQYATYISSTWYPLGLLPNTILKQRAHPSHHHLCYKQ